MDPKFATNPAAGVIAATPSGADVVLGSSVRGIYVGGTGNVAVTMQDGSTGTFSGVPTGAVLPICPAKIMNSGTTATLILALV